MLLVDRQGGAGLPDVDQGPRIVIATSITTGIALLVVLARFYVRIWVVQNVGLDDYVMGLTMALSLAGWAIIIPEVKYGAGRHMAYVMDTVKTAMQLNFATQVIYLWAIGTVKISIGLMLVRFAPAKGYKLFIHIVIVLMAIYTTICFFTLIFQCHKIESIWDINVKSKCFAPKQLMALSYTNTALNILTDLIFAFLPFLMLRGLQVNLRVKVSLICILSLGVFACVAAFIKLSILPNYGKTGDFTWDYTDLTIWVVVEANMGIIAGSLPTLKPLFKRALNIYSTKKTKGYSSAAGNYRLSKMSKGGSKNVTLSSGNFEIIHAQDRRASHLSPGQYSSSAYANINGTLADNSSEERILPAQHQEEIVCTTEVLVSSFHHKAGDTTSM
ncbi:uncharacterized protein CIMG_07316 [Coccidioides immitis RS]|uniref:Integral membrane protein n=3 Tax=Coccidioides immitis TaxID=5501 RepID=J3KA31_COCIM|nr:uncharacterized protein CIMG_07316 [Coccidioides immitis RS]EAS31837.3 integral membrane protein [Coccidioides immitis RS]KMP02433.1 hypothetical protein CIRG_10256 [Coccidioides immitis RMSCC 2394]